MSAVENVTTESDDGDNSRSRSGVFRRIMARDLYDVTKRVEELEQSTRSPWSKFLTSWPHIAFLLILVMLFVGSILYFGHRIGEVEMLQRQEILALRSELESKQTMIDELRQTIQQQARSLRATTASSVLATDVSEPAMIMAEDVDTVRISAPPLKSRTPLPAYLKPGEVLLIVASTLTKEEAIDQALALELDGHASEVILGVSDYYGVALGRFDFEQAKRMKSSIVTSESVNTPYLINDESIDSYVYP